MLPPIAMIHHVSDASDLASLQGWRIAHKTFSQLIDYLKDNHYQTVTFRDIATDKTILRTPSKKVILTFDDCPKHLLDFAVPELQKHNMKAVFFMPTAHIGQYNIWDVEEGRARVPLMDEADLKALSDAGMEIGAHAHHHKKLKAINSAAELTKEITLCKSIIEHITHQTVYSFSYPYASLPKYYKQLLTAAGYQYAVSIYQPFENKLALRRFGCYDSDTEASLKFKLSPLYKWIRTLYDPFKKYSA